MKAVKKALLILVVCSTTLFADTRREIKSLRKKGESFPDCYFREMNAMHEKNKHLPHYRVPIKRHEEIHWGCLVKCEEGHENKEK